MVMSNFAPPPPALPGSDAYVSYQELLRLIYPFNTMPLFQWLMCLIYVSMNKYAENVNNCIIKFLDG